MINMPRECKCQKHMYRASETKVMIILSNALIPDSVDFEEGTGAQHTASSPSGFISP